MRQLQLKKLFFWFAFLTVGFFSCYWTSESLYIWQPVLGRAGSWLLAILFYIIASIGFQMILNACNRHYDFYGHTLGRGASLIVGIIFLICFWLVCSMPTNTHTLLYNEEARAVITDDLFTTRGYLNELQKNNKAIKDINTRYDSKEQEVSMIFTRLAAEMDDPLNKGIGPRFRAVVAELNATLGPIDKNAKGGRSIQEVKNVGSNPTQWLATFYQYKNQANSILKIYRTACDVEIAKVRESMGNKELKNLITRCDISYKDITTKPLNADIIEAADKDLQDSYSFIKDNARFIDFKNETDSASYCAQQPKTRIKMLQNVPNVWKDYLTTDRYKESGFTWWILISILVDIAGFIFFYLANK